MNRIEKKLQTLQEKNEKKRTETEGNGQKRTKNGRKKKKTERILFLKIYKKFSSYATCINFSSFVSSFWVESGA